MTRPDLEMRDLPASFSGVDTMPKRAVVNFADISPAPGVLMPDFPHIREGLVHGAKLAEIADVSDQEGEEK